MKFSEVIKPISYIVTHASEVIRFLNETQGTMIITHNGVARAVILDISEYERIQDTLASLKKD